MTPTPTSTHRHQAEICSNHAWEQAYLRFETPEEEIHKFIKQLVKMEANHWPRGAKIVELFCGRGTGLHALNELGFTNVEGVDLSAPLLEQYDGPAKCYVGDCRQLPFKDHSKDILIEQGGLHHLLALPDDLEQVLSEVCRVLRSDGQFVTVEPWRTPFLTFVHVVCRNRLAGRLWPKLDSLGTMVRYEQQTYDQWLGQPNSILDMLEKYFEIQMRSIGWGKLMLVSRPRSTC